MVREFINACWFAFKWGLLAALMAAVGLGFYFYTQLNDQIRLRVQAKFASHYQNLRVTVRGAHLIDGEGIEVRGLLISDPNLTGPQAELAYFDEILLCCDTDLQELLQGAPNISRIIVRRPRFHATRAVDGSWSFKKLLPMPKFGNRPLDLTIENGQAIVFDMQRSTPSTFTVRDINLEIKPPAQDPKSPSAVAAKPTPISSIRGTLAADHVQRVEFEGRLDRSTGWFDIAGDVAGIDICPEIMAALPADWAERLKPISPLRGQAALDFHVWHDATLPQPVQFEVSGNLSSGRFEEARLPHALADLKASFRADNFGITLDKLSATNGKTSIDLRGRIDGYHRGAPIVIEGEAKHLLIGPQWEALLPPKMLEQWRKFLPQGEIHIQNGRVAFDGQRWQTQGIVRCLNVSFSYYRFPYRLIYGSGNIELTRDNRLILDLTAYAASRPVKITGEFLNPGPNFTGDVVLSGEQLPFDASLYRALEAAQPKSCQVVQSLDPKGTFNFWVRTWRDDPSQPKMDQHVRIWLNRCSICYEKFPYAVHNITGNETGDAPLEMVNGQWYFRGLRGTNHSGLITCEGQLRTAGTGAELELRFSGREIMLEDELRNALTPRMKRLWDNLAPQGSVNIDAKMVYNTLDRKLDLMTRLVPVVDTESPTAAVNGNVEQNRPRSGSVRTVSIQPSFFPYRLEKLQGEIVYRDGRVDLNKLRAVHDHTPISANGYCDCTPEGAWHLHFDRLTVDSVRLDRDRNLNAALPPMLRKAVFQLNPTGLVSMRGQLDLWGQPVGGNTNSSAHAEACLDQCHVRSAWNLAFDMQQGAVHAGVDLKNISGEVVLNGDYDPQREPGQRLRCSGQLGLDTVTWNDFQFTHVQGPMWLDDRQVILGSAAVPRQNGAPLRYMTAKCFGGTVRADGWVGLEETPRFSMQAVVTDGDLNRFCTEAVPGRQQLRGKVLASVNLGGNASGLHTLSGQGQVQLREADIYKLPLMMALLKILNFREPNTNAFSTSDIKFLINGEHITLKEIEFAGDAISLRGSGTMKLNSEIDLTLHSLVGRSDLQLDAWKSFMGGASEQIMQIHVTGTLADPKTSRQAFPTITQALQSLQTGMQPQERPTFPQGMRLFPRADATERR